MYYCLRQMNFHHLVIFQVVLMPVLDCHFAIDCLSHVRLYIQFHLTTSFWNQILINVGSVAIWNRNKVAAALALTVWVITIGFHIYSKSLPLTASAEDPESHTNVGW